MSREIFVMAMQDEQKKLQQLLDSGKLEPFIKHIRFPRYKNLAADTRIEFNFPITALVGANGTNKSSVLRALYGSPGYNNLGNLWFSTSIDPIEDSAEGPNCFIYGYKNIHEGKVVEVLKTRVRKEDDPDYWEPSRPIIKYGMQKMPELANPKVVPPGRSKTRWDTVEKNVVYFDFRAVLSAYDKFFYHGELRGKPSTFKNKKDFIRARSPHLKKAIENLANSVQYRKSERIVNKEVSKLSDAELKAVSRILGRNYEEIRLIRHTFFNCDAYTCVMRISGLRYTEAFAGSGEFAVVRLVVDVIRAQDCSLILLDEPEVSLHPGAQDRLVDFLFEQVKKAKHQVVFTTHSPAIVRKLPPSAIKVFSMESATGQIVLVNQEALPEEAFFHLGEPIHDKVAVIVEDALAKAIVEKVLKKKGEAIARLFEVRFFPGGSQTLWGHYLPIFSAENRKDILVLLDGDQRPSEPLLDPLCISESEEHKVAEEIKRVSGVDIVFHVDGGHAGGNEYQRNLARRNFLKWAREHVDYLPGEGNPEAFTWENMQHDARSNGIKVGDYKSRFEKLARAELDVPNYENIDSRSILTIQRQRLATIPDAHADLDALGGRLLSFAKSAGLTGLV